MLEKRPRPMSKMVNFLLAASRRRIFAQREWGDPRTLRSHIYLKYNQVLPTCEKYLNDKNKDNLLWRLTSALFFNLIKPF